MSIDKVASVELEAPFEYNDSKFRAAFKPFSYQSISIDINDKTEFTGTIVPIVPQVSDTESKVTIGSYSLPGVLGDCTPPISALPLSFKKQNLHEIAETLAKPFGIKVKAEADPGAVFDKVKISPDKEIMKTLSELAKTRAQVISNTSDGRLLFWQAVDKGRTVALLEQGQSPLKSVKPVFNYTNYYSELTGIQPVRVRAKNTVNYTVENSLLSDVVRPHVFKVPNSKNADLQSSVEFKAGRMFADMVLFSAEVATWRDSAGELWEPNTLVRVIAPSAMIYDFYDFVIKGVTLVKQADSETAILELMLPGSFTNKIPKVLPWDE